MKKMLEKQIEERVGTYAKELERRLLGAYVEELRSYRATWALPASRTVHLNAWAAARAKVDPKNLRKTS